MVPFAFDQVRRSHVLRVLSFAKRMFASHNADALTHAHLPTYALLLLQLFWARRVQQLAVGAMCAPPSVDERAAVAGQAAPATVAAGACEGEVCAGAAGSASSDSAAAGAEEKDESEAEEEETDGEGPRAPLYSRMAAALQHCLLAATRAAAASLARELAEAEAPAAASGAAMAAGAVLAMCLHSGRGCCSAPPVPMLRP